MPTEHEGHVIDLRVAASVADPSPRTPVAALVSRPAVEVPAAASVAEAARLMREEQVSSLLVEQDGGIITERDVARGVAAGRDPGDPVSALATPHALCVDGATPIVRAAEIMLCEELRHLVVRMPGGVNGVVSLRAIMAVLVEVPEPQTWLASLHSTLPAPPEVWIG